MLKSYLPILVFAALGLGVGGALVMLNHVIGPKRARGKNEGQTEAEIGRAHV